MKAKKQNPVTDPLGTLLRLLRPAFRGTYAAVEASLENTGVSAPMLGMLEALSDGQARTVPDMARELLIPRQFSLKLAVKLLELGHVARETRDTHRNSHAYRITQSGITITRATRLREQVMSRELRKQLTNREIRIASEVLKKIAAQFPMAANGDE